MFALFLIFTWKLFVVSAHTSIASATLSDSPNRNTQRLQRAQNTLAHVVTADRSTSSQDRLFSLHWLPIQQRITYKLANTIYKAVNWTAPSISPDFSVITRFSSQLRSSGYHLLSISRIHTAFGFHDFHVCGPCTWNSPPCSLSSSDTFSQSCSHLNNTASAQISPRLRFTRNWDIVPRCK